MRRMISRLAAMATVALACTLPPGPSGPARAEIEATDCLSEDWGRRIAGCTRVIESGSASPEERATAYANRALVFSLQGRYGDAIRDYDDAIRIEPDFAVALNNRAWAWFKWGQGPKGLADVERSLVLNPLSEHTWDTRAHIRQVMGNFAGAFADYEQAVNLGGERMVKLYQCGLAAAGLYKGQMDGYYSEEVRTALRQCAYSKTCDPLPADEECKAPLS